MTLELWVGEVDYLAWFITKSSPVRIGHPLLNIVCLCFTMKNMPQITIKKVKSSTFVRLKINRGGQLEFVVMPSKLYNEAKENNKLETHILTYIG